jgi:hypothetical protein
MFNVVLQHDTARRGYTDVYTSLWGTWAADIAAEYQGQFPVTWAWHEGFRAVLPGGDVVAYDPGAIRAALERCQGIAPGKSA